jgi:hypothetical protein
VPGPVAVLGLRVRPRMSGGEEEGKDDSLWFRNGFS